MLSKTSLTQIKDTLNVFSSSTVTQADQWLPGVDGGWVGTGCKGASGTFWGVMEVLSWLWWWLHRCIYVSKLIRLHLQGMFLLCVNCNLLELLLKKAVKKKIWLEIYHHSDWGTRPLKNGNELTNLSASPAILVFAEPSSVLTCLRSTDTYKAGTSMKLSTDAQSHKVFSNDFNNLAPWQIWHKCLFKN